MVLNARKSPDIGVTMLFRQVTCGKLAGCLQLASMACCLSLLLLFIRNVMGVVQLLVSPLAFPPDAVDKAATFLMQAVRPFSQATNGQPNDLVINHDQAFFNHG